MDRIFYQNDGHLFHFLGRIDFRKHITWICVGKHLPTKISEHPRIHLHPIESGNWESAFSINNRIEGLCNLNFDGSGCGNPRLAGMGGIIRSNGANRGKWFIDTDGIAFSQPCSCWWIFSWLINTRSVQQMAIMGEVY